MSEILSEEFICYLFSEKYLLNEKKEIYLLTRGGERIFNVLFSLKYKKAILFINIHFLIAKITILHST